ncbi:MAG: pyruvate kinase [Candidatus Moranbacteria bacterium CG_4_9_14_3_um_filter_40_7]|nr:MAG: pyruvate kinase [Candidatus Moranbacteria bacterium CG23_combo_of_CG06-09_8_20_14_all_40_16]PIU80433.1 MAG: pyruvate kinase [Candidatus Moranbacteria bacterium CG06_land_8_20_14_3_00_40_12]PJA87846.1 MAG: pyruvate kinase [Candidatus Moranbacteria bacterium CG_4_9_14_3_um_filter_40_7]
MKMIPKTKIVATIGPSSDSREKLREMMKAGMNVARINFSHGTHASNGQSIANIKELRKEMGIPIGIMADLQGPRIRTLVENDIKIEKGKFVLVSDVFYAPNFQFPISNFQTIFNDKISNDKKITLDVEKIIESIEAENEILIEDGLIKIVIREKGDGVAIGEVINGGTIKNHKGVNLPDTRLNLPILTAKDEADLRFVLEQEVDFVALSFVGNGSELEMVGKKVKEILKRENDLPQIVSKIERREALKNMDEIIRASDTVMVARGDLGIETPESEVAIHQKEIIAKCLRFSRPVIVATQMLNSMIENPVPTRAEVADVSNAVIDHADAVMLSGESANGRYPVEAVLMMKEIILKTEKSPFDDAKRNYPREYEKYVPTLKLIQKSSQKNAVLFSADGVLARLVSNCRKEQNLMIGTNNFKVYNQLALVWGVNAYFFAKPDPSKVVDLTVNQAQKEGKITKNEEVLKVA